MWTREKTRVDGGLRTHEALAFCAALLLCCGRLSGAVVANGFVIVDALGVRVTGTGVPRLPRRCGEGRPGQGDGPAGMAVRVGEA